MARLILLLHRYLGIGVGVLMVMWCLSGVVMMYVSYPALAESARLQALEPIVWDGCCKVPQALRASLGAGGSTIEMLAGRPVLFRGASQDERPIDLVTGSPIENISVRQATEIARRFSVPGSMTAESNSAFPFGVAVSWCVNACPVVG